ncbi:MIF4G-domain-containing protein [Parathielavia hyrcaniae]|uniref:Pre-mRNA-splicing factor CWC22 n=1 Tax=Parathielavia hyrcaniae TaxID=113614 RepID=A0AAN6T7A0_9PEZI|nr:MIF4G-domain-containing protein [Parathielavia hyrcaniae]
MASLDVEAPSRRSDDPRPSPSPVDRGASPSPRRDRSFSRDSRYSGDVSPPRGQFRDDSRDRSPTRSPRSPLPRRGSPPPRGRSRSRSEGRSPARSPPRRSPPPARRDADRYRPVRKEHTPPPVPPAKTEEEKLAEQRAEYQKLLNLRSQGVYLPPQKLRALQAAITDRTTKEYQRMAWDALKKSINGLVNKVNTANIKFVVPELFGENLIRGRGLFCQSLLKAQHASLPFTPIYACLAAICNTKLPEVGELLVKRLIMRFRKAYKRNDKAVCLSSTMFIAHLVNNQVVSGTLAVQILFLLLKRPTDDSVEIAVGFMREVGLFLDEMMPRVANGVFDQFRSILHEADIDRRTQYMIEVLFQVRKDKYKDNPVIKEELDLVEEEDQITHTVTLDEEIETQDGLNVFKYDPDWQANEEKYKQLKAEILGEGSGDEDEEDESESESESENEDQKAIEIKDQSNADLVNLRRTIYLTIQSSADPEEAAHKLMKLRLPAGQEPELVSMIIESCAQEKVYLKFMGLLGERFARLNRMWMDLFEEAFMKYYSTIHRYETNKLRNIARFFGHLLASDAIGWHVFSAIHLNEEETTSASRIFIKILFEDLQENMGTAKLKTRMADETLQPSFQGIFPHDEPRNIRFAINYLTAIKMGFLTDEMRAFLANIPKPALPTAPAAAAADESDSESASGYSSYSSYSSRSPSRTPPPRRAINRGRSVSRTPPPRRGRPARDDRSYSRSLSRSRSYTRSISRTPPPRRGRSPSRSRSLSRSRAARGRGRERSYTRSLTRSLSPSRSPSRSPLPPPRRGGAGASAGCGIGARRRSYSRSVSVSSRSRSPSRSRSSAFPTTGGGTVGVGGKRRREGSYSPSRSPAPPPTRRVRRFSRSGSRGGSRSVSRSPVRMARGYSRSRSPGRGLRDAGAGGGGVGRGGRGGRAGVMGRGSRAGGENGWAKGRAYEDSRSMSRSLSRSPSRSRSPPPKRRDGAGGGRNGNRDREGDRAGSYRGDRGRGGSYREGRDSRSRSRSPARSSAGAPGKRRRYYSSSRSRSPPVVAKRGRA